MYLYIMKIYLCGPVEHDTHADDWRTRLTQQLPEHQILNPLIKPDHFPPEAKMPQGSYWKAWERSQGNPTPELLKAFKGMHYCINACRAMVLESDLLICRLPKIFTVGTIEELLLAKQWGKKVLFLCPDGPPSFWLMAEFACPHSVNDVFILNEQTLLEKIGALNETWDYQKI